MIKNVKTIIIVFFGNIIFLISCLIPKNKNLWIFGAWFGDKYADNSKYLFEYVNKNKPEIRAIWVTRNENTYKLVKKEGYEVYFKNSLKGFLYSSLAGVGIISNAFNDIPYTTGRMKIVQLWHGTPLKKIVFDETRFTLNKDSFKRKIILYLKDFDEKNIYISSSDEVKKIFTKAFRVPPNRIKVTGYPRNDFNYNMGDIPIKTLLKNLREKKIKIGIYMPTHRMEGKNNSIKSLIENIDNINSVLRKINSFLLVKVHYCGLNKEKIKNHKYDRIYLLQDEDINQDVYKILPFTDYLITDYSSVYFDYMLLNKPIIFAPFDIDDYIKNDREFYYNYNDVTPGPKAYNWKEVLKYINKIVREPNRYKDQRKIINQKFNKYNDNKNCQRVVNEIIKEI